MPDSRASAAALACEDAGHPSRRLAVFAVTGIVCVLFTFIGVNVLFTGLHSYK